MTSPAALLRGGSVTGDRPLPVEKQLSEFGERFENVEAQLKTLFQKTQFENLTIFKYMKEKIDKTAALSDEFIEKFTQLNELLILTSKHDNPSMIKSLELDLMPNIMRKVEFETGKMIKVKTKDFLMLKQYKDEMTALE